MGMVNGYWRNGPVLNNAVSGIDQALWDIKGQKSGNAPLSASGRKVQGGGRLLCTTPEGGDREEVLSSIRTFMDQGYRHIRVQMGGYGGDDSAEQARPDGSPPGAYYEPKDYMRRHVKLFSHIREHLGEEIELLHDIHERLRPIEAIEFAKDLEPFKLFFLEDALAPEDVAWFRTLRRQCATPLAMGELFNHPLEWQPLIEERLIDFIRMHVSQMGGITPARNVAAFANMYGIRTSLAWTGGCFADRSRGATAPRSLGAQLRHPGVVALR